MSTQTTTPSDTAIRPLTGTIPQEDLDDLRARILATRWPEAETVDDISQGPRLASMQALARYWVEDYDWDKCEERLDALTHFLTEIDGLDIHFIHVRSEHEDALPLIVTHGWPGSVVEQLKIVDPLTNPTAHGGSAADAFHLVIPSLPGCGFSGKPAETGWGPERIASAWTVLMKRLGYTRFVASGGDWGAVITDQMGVQAPRSWPASTQTWPASFHPMFKRQPSQVLPRPTVSPKRKPASTRESRASSRRTWRTHWRWGPIRRPCTGLRTHPSVWPPG